MIFLVLIAQGYIQLFFGYVENYTLYTLVLASYVLAALRYLEGRTAFAVPGVLFVLALALHLSAAVLGLSFVVLFYVALSRGSERFETMRDLLIMGALVGLLDAALGSISPGYSWITRLSRLTGAVTNPTSSYGFNPPKAFDFVNQQVLIGPLALFLLVPAAAVPLVMRRWGGVRSIFVFAVATGYLVASCIAGDSNLGVARNWDLLAPAGFVFTWAGLHFALNAEWRFTELRRWLLLLLLVSLFHTVPWVAVNASFDRAFDRFKALPLGLGRTQATVGYWYLSKGREHEAFDWFRRALDENPANNLAAFNLGRIAMRHQGYDFAARAFLAALRARPTVQLYRLALANALAHGGQLQEASAELDTLLTQAPGEPTYWTASCIVRFWLGDRASAEAALEHAARLAPGDSAIASVRANLTQSEASIRNLQRDWSKIVDVIP